MTKQKNRNIEIAQLQELYIQIISLVLRYLLIKHFSAFLINRLDFRLPFGLQLVMKPMIAYFSNKLEKLIKIFSWEKAQQKKSEKYLLIKNWDAKESRMILWK